MQLAAEICRQSSYSLAPAANKEINYDDCVMRNEEHVSNYNQPLESIGDKEHAVADNQMATEAETYQTPTNEESYHSGQIPWPLPRH